MLWVVVAGLTLLAPIASYAQQAKSGFSCEGRENGYYADVSTGCQVYHMCDGIGRQFSYTCPNATLFQQRMLICDHWYMVNCSRAEKDYTANLLIGQKRPFVEDLTYDRTPRPDLLEASKNEADFIYRTGKSQYNTPKNVVGLQSEDKSPSDEPTYFPPSHWSTSYTPQSTTLHPRRIDTQSQNRRVENERRNQTPNVRSRSKAINFESRNRNGNNFNAPSKAPQKVKVNFESNFKATTPVYPTTVEDTTSSANNIGLLPPIPYVNSRFDTPTNLLPQKPQGSPESQGVNFQSDFKATTPVYPSKDELDKILEIQQQQKTSPQQLVNRRPQVVYESNFEATTPVYPTSVEATSPDPGEVGLIAPIPDKDKILGPPAPASFQVNFKSNFKATTPVYPTSVDQTSPNPNEAGLQPPQQTNSVAFESNFKATTPVYPTSVEPTSPDPGEAGLLAPGTKVIKDPQVNYESKFKATTPVYPTHVDATSPDPGDVGLLAPQDNHGLNLGLIAPVYNPKQETAPEDLEATPEPPSRFYQAPKFGPDYTSEEDIVENEIPGVKILNFMKSFNSSQWHDIRQALSIPEYDFPLEDATRPSYDSIVSSFVARKSRRSN